MTVPPILPAEDEEALAAAADALASGRAVVVPTDTVYGIAVDPWRPGATARLFAAKGRPPEVALPVLIAGAEVLEQLAEGMTDEAAALARRFWPGGLTLVLNRRAGLDVDLGGDARTVGVRVPAHPTVLALLRRVGPLATTSANRHGRPTPATAAEVAAELGDGVELVLDAGPCAGAPSTVVDCTGRSLRVLREGVVPATEILATGILGP